MTRSFLILVPTVIGKDSITISRVLTSHLFHSSMVWEQIFLSNASLLRSLSAFCEYAVAVDLFGSCLQRQNREFIHQNIHSQNSENSALRRHIFDSQTSELSIFHRSWVLLFWIDHYSERSQLLHLITSPLLYLSSVMDLHSCEEEGRVKFKRRQ